MVLGVLLLLGFLSLGVARHRGRGGSFAAVVSLAAAASALGAVGVALGRSSGRTWIAAHALLGAGGAAALAYRWLVAERHLRAARIGGAILVLIAAAALAGRCHADHAVYDATSPPAMAAKPVVLVYAEDLLFTSRIREAARELALEVRVARNAAALADAVAAAPPRIVLADLDSPRLAAVNAIVPLRASLGGARLVGFFSHVHVERSTEARNAGFDAILARSAFVRELPAILRAAAAPS
jgi:hypothetical protein